jgi:hypothetical protein
VWRNGPQTFLCKIKIGSTAKKPRLHNSTGKWIVVYFIVLHTLRYKQKTADNKSQAQIKGLAKTVHKVKNLRELRV